MIEWRKKSLSVKRTWGVNKILNGDVIGDVKNDNGDGPSFPFSKCPIQSPVSILEIISNCDIDFWLFSIHLAGYLSQASTARSINAREIIQISEK